MGPEIRQKELRTGPAGACGCAEGTGGDRVCRSWQSFGSVQPPLPGGFRSQHVSWHFCSSRAVLTAAAFPSLHCCTARRPGHVLGVWWQSYGVGHSATPKGTYRVWGGRGRGEAGVSELECKVTRRTLRERQRQGAVEGGPTRGFASIRVAEAWALKDGGDLLGGDVCPRPRE